MAAARKPFLLLIVLLFTVNSGCLQDSDNKNREITVSAAISLSDALKDIGEGFRKQYPDITVYFNFGASGTLEKQIEQGASVDIFASASQKEMDLLEEKGLIIRATRTNFTGNRLVIIAPSSLQVEDLGSLDRIAMGNPKTVPAGRYAMKFLENAGIYDMLKPRIIFAENVRQVLDYVERGEADAGFVYFSDTLKSDLTVSRINDSLYPPVVYPVAVLKDSRAEISGRFIEYLKSDEGQVILQRHGFG